MYKVFLLLTLLVFFGCTTKHEGVPTFSEATISPDGVMEKSEWRYAIEYDLPAEGKLYLIQNDEDILLGIRFKEKVGNYVNIFLSNDSIGTINLHASMQLGERLLIGNWNDTIPEWNWGNNQEWIANTIRYKEHNEKLLLMESIEPYDGFEFKISKNKIKQNKLLIRIEIKDFTGTGKDRYYPENSVRENTRDWLNITL